MEKEYKKVFVEHILNTPPESRIILIDISIGTIPAELQGLLCSFCQLSTPEVYMSTKSLKHVYDKRSKFLMENLDGIYEVFRDPDCVVRGREDQRAQFIFLKKIGEDKFLTCPAEICEKEDKKVLFCVTFFPARTPYIKKSTILWSREDGAIPPS